MFLKYNYKKNICYLNSKTDLIFYEMNTYKSIKFLIIYLTIL